MSTIPFGFRADRIKEQVIYRPYVQVELKTSTGEWIPFTALVDSGADYILLPRSACDVAGYTWKDGLELELHGIADKKECTVGARIHELSVRIGKEELVVPVAFAATEVPKTPLLGREGVFTRFDVYFKQRSHLGEFRP